MGDIISRWRSERFFTQDEYGLRYGISGPAIFKFEKGHLRPSLAVWMNMAKDAGLSERRAALLWLRAKLPEKLEHFLDVPPEGRGTVKGKGGKVDYSSCETRDEMREEVKKDKRLPKGLRDLLSDDELWNLFKPVGHEVNMLRDLFSPLGKGSKAIYRDALLLIREFTHSF